MGSQHCSIGNDHADLLAHDLSGPAGLGLVGAEGLHRFDTLPLAAAVEAAWTPDGPGRDELARRIGARRGMSPTQALTVLQVTRQPA